MKSRSEIERLLFADLERAREKYHGARNVLIDATHDIPSGLPHPDGAVRIRNAGKDSFETLEAYAQALKEFDQFLLSGKIPERYRGD